MNDERFRAAIYVHLFRKLNAKGDISIQEYAYESGKKYFTAYGLITDSSDSIYLIVAAPNISDDVYLMLTDGDPKLLSRELAGIQQYNEEKAHVCLDHTIPSEGEYLNDNGWSAYVILVPETVHRSLSSTGEIHGATVKFRLVVPITENERQMKMASDIEALLEHFDETGRDIISFAQ